MKLVCAQLAESRSISAPSNLVMINGRIYISLWSLAHEQYCPEKGFPEWIINPTHPDKGTIQSKTRGGPFSSWSRFRLARLKGEIER